MLLYSDSGVLSGRDDTAVLAGVCRRCRDADPGQCASLMMQTLLGQLGQHRGSTPILSVHVGALGLGEQNDGRLQAILVCSWPMAAVAEALPRNGRCREREAQSQWATRALCSASTVCVCACAVQALVPSLCLCLCLSQKGRAGQKVFSPLFPHVQYVILETQSQMRTPNPPPLARS